MRRRRAELSAPSFHLKGRASFGTPRSGVPSFGVFVREPLHILAVRLHEITDSFAPLTGVRTGVRDRASESDVIANELVPERLRLEGVDVRLLDPEVPGRVPANVWVLDGKSTR